MPFDVLAASSSAVTVCSYHVTYAFQSEPTLCICLNVKELLAPRGREIWSLSDYNWTWTHNHVVHKRKLNHLANLAKCLSCVVSTYLYGAFDRKFLSCHVRISEWIQTLYMPECQGTPCSKQVRNLTFKWLHLDSNPQQCWYWCVWIWPTCRRIAWLCLQHRPSAPCRGVPHYNAIVMQYFGWNE